MRGSTIKDRKWRSFISATASATVAEPRIVTTSVVIMSSALIMVKILKVMGMSLWDFDWVNV